MGKLLFGSFLKVIVWLIVIGCIVAGIGSSPIWLAVAGVFLLGGPCVAIPAVLAARGKTVASKRELRLIQSTIYSTFAAKKMRRNWQQVEAGEGDMNFVLLNTKPGCEPTVSVEFADAGDGMTVAHIWLSHWTSGGLNGGKGTPFWVWGSARALSKVREAAKAIEQGALAPTLS